MLYLYVADCAATYEAALAAGATSIQAPEDQFYGDRVAAVAGPQGNQWWLATRVETLSADELQRRATEKERSR